MAPGKAKSCKRSSYRQSHEYRRDVDHHHHGGNDDQGYCEPCRSFGQKCSHLVKKQRAKFYILRRCIAMLVCWRDRGDNP